MKPTAISEGLFTFNADSTRIFDVANRPASPYEAQELFTLATFQGYVKAYKPIQFVIPTALWQSAMSSIEIDFGDGKGFRTLTPNNPVSVTYNTDGMKYIKARKTGTSSANSPQNKSGSNVIITQLWTIRPGLFDTQRADYRWQITATTAYQGSRPTLTAEVWLGCGGVLDKPVIIMEGFDPDGQTTNEITFRSFFRNSDLLQSLYSQGYDLIFVNWEQNGTYIEANALALEALLNYVNQQKVGTARSTVIGLSMGGLIARWCLKDMEDRGIDHKVGNYFSYDSPHQGANVPIGMQFLFSQLKRDLPFVGWRWLLDVFDGRDAAGEDAARFNQLTASSDSPAAKQMLVLHYGGIMGLIDPLRTNFAQKLQNKGYPALCQNYAISNGRGNGIGQGYNSGDKIFNTDIVGILLNVFMDAWSLEDDNSMHKVGEFFAVGITLKKVFGFLPLPLPLVNYSKLKVRSQLPYDVAPGGQANTQEQFLDNIDPIDLICRY